MNKVRTLALTAVALALLGCSSTQYIIGTRSGQLLTAYGKPELDDKTGTYTYRDSEGRKATISKADVGQIMER